MFEEIKLIEINDQAFLVRKIGETAHLRTVEKAIIGFVERHQHNADLRATAKWNGREECLDDRVTYQPGIDFALLIFIACDLKNPPAAWSTIRACASACLDSQSGSIRFSFVISITCLHARRIATISRLFTRL